MDFTTIQWTIIKQAVRNALNLAVRTGKLAKPLLNGYARSAIDLCIGLSVPRHYCLVLTLTNMGRIMLGKTPTLGHLSTVH